MERLRLSLLVHENGAGGEEVVEGVVGFVYEGGIGLSARY